MQYRSDARWPWLLGSVVLGILGVVVAFAILVRWGPPAFAAFLFALALLAAMGEVFAWRRVRMLTIDKPARDRARLATLVAVVLAVGAVLLVDSHDFLEATPWSAIRR